MWPASWCCGLWPAIVGNGGEEPEVVVADRAVQAIRDRIKEGISFQWFRTAFKADHDLKDSLAYGHAVIDTVPKLDQYLYTYGPMIESQWECVASYLSEVDKPTRWIDCGCGQGLAGLLISDLTRGSLLSRVRDIFLIEPSAVALARAEAIYESIAPGATSTCVCKRFDELSNRDIPPADHRETLHIFSNTLDVLGFDPLRLFKKTLQPGRHTILSVNHDRSFNGGTPRIESIKAAFESPVMAPDLTIFRSTLDRFRCNNPRQSEGVVWLCKLEVHHG